MSMSMSQRVLLWLAVAFIHLVNSQDVVDEDAHLNCCRREHVVPRSSTVSWARFNRHNATPRNRPRPRVAFTTLTACSANAHLRKKQIRRLLDIANAAKDHNIDTVAMVILALRCISKDHRHRNLQHSLRRPTINLAREQQPDGGFGNLYNTALVIQALQDIIDASSHWNETAAKYYIESRQDPDGAYTDPGLTANVVLSLQPKGLGAIRTLNCGKSSPDIKNQGYSRSSFSYL
ncbi:hypothetical protein FQA39_LY18690 [Lamprigera yunnana]|nr:hypothetical protein FQA39_LY18690 [Lamprigera yunnana]